MKRRTPAHSRSISSGTVKSIAASGPKHVPPGAGRTPVPAAWRFPLLGKLPHAVLTAGHAAQACAGAVSWRGKCLFGVQEGRCMFRELDLRLSAEQTELKEAVHQFAAKVLRPAAAALDRMADPAEVIGDRSPL